MGRIERDVEVEGFGGFPRFLQEFQGEVDIRHSGIEIGGRDFPWFSVEAEGLVTCEKVAGSAEVSEVALKTEIRRFFLEMPLAGHRREVAGLLEDLGGSNGMRQRDISRRDAVLPG